MCYVICQFETHLWPVGTTSLYQPRNYKMSAPIPISPYSHHVGDREGPAEPVHVVDAQLAAGLRLGEGDDLLGDLDGRGHVAQLHLRLHSMGALVRLAGERGEKTA